jgi:hypothetical protein
MQVANWLSKQSLRKIYPLIASGITNAVVHHGGVRWKQDGSGV